MIHVTYDPSETMGYTAEVRYLGILVCIGLLGCNFDTSTSAPKPSATDGAVPTGGAIDGDVVIFTDGNGPSPVDASSPPADADLSSCLSTCTATGASCSPNGTCVYTCTDESPCGNIQCPDNLPCEVNCTASGDTTPCGNVSCAQLQPCEVNCVDTEGDDTRACNNVSCNGACSCDVSCSGSEAACNSTNCNALCGVFGSKNCTDAFACNVCSFF